MQQSPLPPPLLLPLRPLPLLPHLPLLPFCWPLPPATMPLPLLALPLFMSPPPLPAAAASVTATTTTMPLPMLVPLLPLMPPLPPQHHLCRCHRQTWLCPEPVVDCYLLSAVVCNGIANVTSASTSTINAGFSASTVSTAAAALTFRVGGASSGRGQRTPWSSPVRERD